MRGRPVREVLGFDEIDTRELVRLRAGANYDVALVVKSPVPGVVRERSNRIVWEPLDLWYGDRGAQEQDPRDWVLRNWEACAFDEIVVSTVPMAEAAEEVLTSRGVRVHLVPHHADPRIGMDWYDADGPIVYAGGSGFVAPVRDQIVAAAAAIDREVKFDHAVHAWRSLAGAALVLAPRIGLRTRMNLLGKPTVKIANAAKGGIPVLATPDPAIRTLYPNVRVAPPCDWADRHILADHMSSALRDEPPVAIVPTDDWPAPMLGILLRESAGSVSRVVPNSR